MNGQHEHVPAFHPISQWAFPTEQAYATWGLHAQSSHAGLLATAITMQLKLLLAMCDPKVLCWKPGVPSNTSIKCQKAKCGMQGFLEDLYSDPAIASTVDFAQIKNGYWMSMNLHSPLNPKDRIPLNSEPFLPKVGTLPCSRDTMRQLPMLLCMLCMLCPHDRRVNFLHVSRHHND